MDMAAADLIGTWNLQAVTARRTDGHVTAPYGEHPRGVLIYDAAGRVTAVIVHGDLEPFETDSIVAASRAEASNAFRRTLAYFGSYRVDDDEHRVVHHIEACTFPNRLGKDEVRRFEIDGSRLILSTPPQRAGGGEDAVFTLVWERS
jgi:hypothetical protein